MQRQEFTSVLKVQKMAENEAEKLIIRYLPELVKTISEPSTLACGLFARRILSRAVYDEAIDFKASSKKEKSVSICDAVLKSVHVTPSSLVEFVEVAKEESPPMEDLCQQISKAPAYSKNAKSI